MAFFFYFTPLNVITMATALYTDNREYYLQIRAAQPWAPARA
jgi:hypothetical protein